MEMFTRQMVLQGPPGAVRSWAVEVAEAYTAATDKPISVWSAITGDTPGTMRWMMLVDGHAELLQLAERASADDDYLAVVERGRQFFTPTMADVTRRPMTHVTPAPGEPGSVALVTTATSEAGSLGHAVGWGIELAEYLTRLTGIDTALLGTVTGPFSEHLWVCVGDAAAIDEAERRTATDDEYRKLLSRGGGFFVSGSSRRSSYVRLH